MVEYINKEAVRDALYEADAILMSGLKILNQFPAADVALVRHGNWDSSGKYEFANGELAIRCSECGCSLRQDEYKAYHWNYCPVCGAKMDGGDPDA